MKRILSLTFSFGLLFLLIPGTILKVQGAGVFQEGSDNPIPGESGMQNPGMPGWPVPDRPIPHHEPGQPARGGDARAQVTQMNALGVEETVELRGIDAMLANGTMADPLQGNYKLVNLDKIMFGSYAYGSPNNFSVQTFEYVTPTLGLIPGTTVDYGNMRFNAIAAGDLNGDMVDEQITAWVLPFWQLIYLNIGQMPGSGGKATSAPAIVAHADGTLDVVVRGYDQALWHTHFDGATWGGWDNDAGGLLLSSPAVVSRAPGEMDVFVVGSDNQVYYNHWADSAWSGWVEADCGSDFPEIERVVPLPEIPAPAVTSRAANQLDIFRRGPDNTLRWCHFSGSWGSWQDLDGMLASGPGAVSLGDGRMQVYALGMDGALWFRTYNSSWGAWQHLETPEGVTGNAFPVLSSPATGQVNVYLAGMENHIWSNQYNGSSWGSWSSIAVTGGDLGLGIGATASPAATHLLAHMADGRLQYRLNASAWESLDGLEESQTFYISDNHITKSLPDDLAVENSIFDITTGYFSGDGRQQIVLAYDDYYDNIRLEIFDIRDGFMITKTAEITSPISGSGWPRVAAGDVDGDGVDEIGLVYVNDDGGRYKLSVFEYDQTAILREIFQSDWTRYPDRWFGGTLRIASGNVVPEESANDEFVVVSDWAVFAGYDHMGILLHIYDHDPDPPSFTQILSNTDYASDDNYWPELHATGVGLAVGNVDNDGIDEIVVTWLDHFYGHDWPDMRRDLVVYSWDGSNFEEIGKHQISANWSRYTFLDTLAVGDLDQDLINEIVWVYPISYDYDWNTYYHLDVYEFDETYDPAGVTYKVRLLDQTELNYGNIPRAFNLALGDFTGESIRVGPPSYRRQHDVGQVTAVVNAPPKHEDVIGGETYNLNADDPLTYSKFEQDSQNSTEISVTTQKDWGVDSKFSSTVGDPEGTHVTASLENSYGENFSNTGGSTQTLTYEQTVSAITHDVLFYTRLDYDVWEYPVYDSHTLAPQGYMSVVWPVGGMQSAVESTNSCDSWYWPNHQLMNVWSYPGTDAKLLDRVGDGSRDLYDAPTYEIGTTGVDFSLVFESVNIDSRSHEYELGFAAGLETQIGGDEVGVNLGVVSFSTRLPSLFFSSRGEYNSSDLSTWKTETMTTTTLSGYFNTIPSGENYLYDVEPFLYWSENDYLVIDYVTDPTNQSFWSSSGANYNKPDPAFILPWQEGQCNHLWPDAEFFSSDVTVDPPLASIGEIVTITATIRNFSKVGNNFPYNQPFNVAFYHGDPDSGGTKIGEQTVVNGGLASRAVIQKSIQWEAQGSGEQHIYVVIDPEDALVEVHDENDLYINNNKGYGVLTMNTIEFIDVGQTAEKVYQEITFQMGNPSPTSTLYIPLETWTENLRVDMQSTDLFGSLNSLGTPFEVVVYQTDWENPVDNFSFAPEQGDPPAAILIDYAGADLTGFDENLLTLFRFNGIGWEPANLVCGLDGSSKPLYPILRLPQDDLLAVPVCRAGYYMLGDDEPPPPNQIFLPLVLK